MVSINILPDEVLLEIFDFYLGEEAWVADENWHPFEKKSTQAWQVLVHVCRQWRSIVFGAPSALDLQLVCTTNTPARDTLDVWPDLPICVRCNGDYIMKNVDNIIAVLEHSDRVFEIGLYDVSFLGLSILLEAMEEPFPELLELSITRGELILPELPDSFLGRSAPNLEFLKLDGIHFDRLPKLLLSATWLSDLHLINVPLSGYISPRKMLSVLFALTCLEHLWLGFRNFPFCKSRRPLPPTPIVLPDLTFFRFEGVPEYLEVLVTHIDAPQLSSMRTTFFNRINSDDEFDTPEFVQFICRTPMLKALEKASVVFEDGIVMVKIWQLLSREQASTLSLPLHSTSQDLHVDEDHIYEAHYEQQPEDLQDKAFWLKILHSFTAVKNLYLSEELAPRIVPILQELVGGRTTRVLPILENIFLEGLESSGPVQEAIGQFMAMRQATSHPVAVTGWERKPVKKDD